MKILLKSRADLLKKPGGDTTQVLKTSEYLKKFGISTDVSIKLEEDLKNYDLVHLFNITRPQETYLQYLDAKKQNKPVILTPIYQNFDEWDEKGRYGMQKVFTRLVKNKNAKETIKTGCRSLSNFGEWKLFFTQLKIGFLQQQKEILVTAKLLLPNSEMEMRKIEEDFGIKNDYRVVPNGVESDFSEAKPDRFKNKYQLDNFVLCVANFASIKNHLNLIKALESTELTLVLIGKSHKNHRRYFQLIKKMAAKNNKILLLENVEKEELKSAYAAAKVHVLASWFETCGLASLEAGLAGCNIVSTDRGYAKEYLGDFAWYCNPADINSIRDSLLKAFHAPKSDKLKSYILENFSWEKTAQKTLSVYNKVLGN